MTAMPMRTRVVRAAMKAARFIGADCTERHGLKWISPSQTPSRPQASAASASSSASANAVASLVPRRRSSTKIPTCMRPSGPRNNTSVRLRAHLRLADGPPDPLGRHRHVEVPHAQGRQRVIRSEEHTSELQSRLHLVCRLLLEKKKKTNNK